MIACRGCKIGFEPNHGARQFCSGDCYSSWKRAAYQSILPTVKCRGCDNHFRKHRLTKFCSTPCRMKFFYRRPKIESRPCETCKKVFTPDRSNGKYCSRRCLERQGRYLEEVRECRACKSQFKPSRVSHWYCRGQCRRLLVSTEPSHIGLKMRRERLKAEIERVPCKRCGNDFDRYNGTGHKYCSARCAKSSANRNGMIARQRRLVEGKEIHCEICGFDRYVERAHILPAKHGWKLTKQNCLLLCPNHHRVFDNGRGFTNEELAKLGIGWLAA